MRDDTNRSLPDHAALLIPFTFVGRRDSCGWDVSQPTKSSQVTRMQREATSHVMRFYGGRGQVTVAGVGVGYRRLHEFAFERRLDEKRCKKEFITDFFK